MADFIVTVGGKDYVTDAPDEGAAWAKISSHVEQQGVERKSRADAQLAADREKYAPEGGALANLGAGFDSVIKGARQLGGMVGIGKGVSDEELSEKRATDKQLAGDSWGNKGLQLAGEILPTLAVPAGGFLRGAQGLTRAAQLAGRGLAGQGARAALPAVARAGAGGGAALGDATLAGGAAGALMPVASDESRIANTALGAAGGAVLPGAVQAWNAGRAALTRAGGQGRASNLLYRALEAERPQGATMVAEAIDRHAPGGLPMTSAQVTGNPSLAAAELGARSKAPSHFTNFDVDQMGAINRELSDAAQDANQVNRLHAERAEVTDPLREAAFYKGDRWSHIGEPLQPEVDLLRQGSTPNSPQRGLAGYMDEVLAENPDAAKLYEARKLLAKKLTGPHLPGDDMAAITKGADRETMRLIESIDGRLDEATDGMWGTYMDHYRAMSRPVDSARAQSDILSELTSPSAPTVGGYPEITQHRLSKAVEKHGTNAWGAKLEPHAQARFDTLRDRLQRIQDPAKAVKRAGTGGGGSQTAMQQELGTALEEGITSIGTKALADVPLLGGFVRAITGRSDRASREEMGHLMRDPRALAQALRQEIEAAVPLSQEQRLRVQALRGAGPSAAVALPTSSRD